MDGHDEALGRIVGQHEVVYRHVDVGGVASNGNPACGVVASRGTDGIDGILVPLVEQGILRIGAAAPVVAGVNLVESLEDELVAVVGKASSHLCPQRDDKG